MSRGDPAPWAATLAQQLLWRSQAFPGRWRVQRWAQQHAGAYNGRRPRRIRMNGFDFLVEADASLDVYLNGITQDSPVERIIRAHVKPGTTVLDIGANIGWTARLMSALVGAGGRVHAFEPLPAAFRNLRRNAEAAPLRNIVPHAVAASDACGTVALYLPAADATALGTMRAPDERDGAIAHEVPMRTLDSQADLLGPVAFAKIDVEGAEHKVLLGMTEIIRRWRPVLAIELTDAWLRQLGSSSQALLDELMRWGYRVLAQQPDGLAELTTAPQQQVDVVCVGAP